MYEQFGASVDQDSRSVTFQLFMPGKAQAQGEHSGPSRITQVSVVGTFQNPQQQWDNSHALPLQASEYRDPKTKQTIGTLYSATVDGLKDGFYEYKYLVEFENKPPRLLTDPCSRYGGARHQNSAFVVGEEPEKVEPISQRLPLQDLVIYELMIDDFTANIKQKDEAPLQAIVRRLDELQELGVNAIEFMPWVAWANKATDDNPENFSWGYDPVQHFALAHKYSNNPSKPQEKLVYLKRLISECHRRGMHVIMDAVLNHADGDNPDKGFPYYWLYENPDDSPFVGEFEEHEYFEDLDYTNQCTFEYIRDACLYWIDTFELDGIRFDNTQGYYRKGDNNLGLPKLISELREHFERTGRENFSLTLEHTWDFEAIEAANEVNATSCWLDPYRQRTMEYLGNRPEGKPQIEPCLMRILDAGRDFGEGRVPTIYLENHDHHRFMLVAGGRENWQLTQPYVIALFTSPGAVLIYNGQEWGADNDMPDVGAENSDERVMPRPLDWKQRQDKEGTSIRELYQRLIKLRAEHPALRTSNFYPSNWEEDATELNDAGFGIDRERNVAVYHRWGQDDFGKEEKLYIVLNFSGESQRLSFEVPEAGPWLDLLSGETLCAEGGRVEAEVGSNWGAIYHLCT